MKELKQEIRELLEDFEYESSLGWGKRKLMSHHVNALSDALLPFIEGKIKGAKQEKASKIHKELI